MSLNAKSITDLVLATQEKLINRGAFLDMQTDLQDHVAIREMWKAKRKKFSGGLDWRFDAQIDHNHSARAVGLYEPDASGMNDTLIKGIVPPRHINAHYIFDVREPALQQGGVSVVDFVMSKKVAMQVSFFELLEHYLWNKPTDSSDVKTPWGIPYWITKGSNGEEGFVGGNPAGFTGGRGGIDSGTYTRYKNYFADYADVSKTDLLRKMRKAHRQTQFRSPVSHSNPSMSMGNGIYTTDSVIGILEELLEDQNMNLGNDLASKEGKSVFKGTPVQWAPKLDEDTQTPVYMLDWKHLGVGVLAGWEDNLTAPYMVAGKHNVRRVDMDVTLNMCGLDIRRQAVLAVVS